MAFTSWIHGVKSVLARCRAVRKYRPLRRPGGKLFLERLEDRLAPATFTVTNTFDDGSPGSLRWAVNQIIADPNDTAVQPDVIAFNIPWNDLGHVYYRGQVNLNDVAPVPADTSSDADLANAALVGSGNTIAAAYPYSWWSIDLQSTLDCFYPLSPYIGGPPLVIDGYSQPGANSNTSPTGDNAILRIEVNGSQIPTFQFHPDQTLTPLVGQIAFNFPNSNSTVRGLVVNGTDPNPAARGYGFGFNVYGPPYTGPYSTSPSKPHDDIWAGNFLGTDVSGTLPDSNGGALYIYAQAYNNRIGSDSAQDYADRNIISGNSYFGVGIFGAGTHNNVVSGNLIGTDRYGNALGNGLFGVGVFWNAQSNQIGGDGGLGNVIAYNGGDSAYWGSNVGGPGVLVADANTTDAHYGLGPTDGNSIEGNAIYGNAGLAIDLTNSFWDYTGAITGQAASVVNSPSWLGVTLNDSAGHTGPNNFQDFPILNLAVSSGTDTSIAGTFSEAAEPNTTITLDFYANPAPDPSGYGQGQTWLGSAIVTTDANGDVAFTADLAVGNLAGQWITATATDPTGDTSEFSADVQATAASSQNYAQYLQAALPQSSTAANSMTIQASTSIKPATVIQAVNGLTNVTQPVTLILDLGGGTYSTGGVTANPPLYVAFVVQNGTLDPFYPALTVSGGQVAVLHCTLTTSGNAPTLQVTGGSVTLRNDTILQTSTAYTYPAISVSGGSTVDLGTAARPGGNILTVAGASPVVVSTGLNVIQTVGDTFQANGATVSPFATVTLASSANPSLLNQPATFTATVSAPTSGGATPTGNVTFLDRPTGNTLGIVALSGSTAQLTVSSLPVNAQTIAAIYSGDSNYITDAATLVQQIHYHFNGFLPPLNSSMALALGRTVPIKFQLADYTGTFITSLSAVTALQVVYPDGSTHAITGLRYDSIANQFVANWSTRGLPVGTFLIRLALADGTVSTKSIQLSKSGSSAGLTTVAAGGTDAAPGGLLGGDIELYVDNTNGDLTADELARIQDTVTAVDAVTETYGVAVTEVTDPTLADVTLTMDTASAVGGYADGVLGCTTAAGQITIINGWNFYAGSDPTQIGTGQYDFETVVTHELGHALGLGHSSDSTSVMYPTLNTGTVNRNLTTADLHVPDGDISGACGLHAVVNVGRIANPSYENGGHPFFVPLAAGPGQHTAIGLTSLAARDTIFSNEFANGPAGQAVSRRAAPFGPSSNGPIFTFSPQLESTEDALFAVPIFTDPSRDEPPGLSRRDEPAGSSNHVRSTKRAGNAIHARPARRGAAPAQWFPEAAILSAAAIESLFAAGPLECRPPVAMLAQNHGSDAAASAAVDADCAWGAVLALLLHAEARSRPDERPSKASLPPG
jgi:hypothetical protein